MSLRTVGLGFSRRGSGGTEHRVLADVEVEFPAGVLSVIEGASGAGKTTLLHLLAGLLRPTLGEVIATEGPISRFVAGHRDRWRRRVGLALQDPHLLPELTALENVMLPLVPRGVAVGALRERARAALGDAAAAGLAGRPVTELSGGERQRVGLARALVGAPDYLLVDEPTAHQDDDRTEQVLGVLRAAATRGAVVVAVGHDARLRDAEGVGRRFLLAEGRLAPCSTR